MAKSAGPGRSAKLSRADKKAARVAKRQSRRETWRNLRQAFTLTRQNDPRFIPYVALFATVAAAATYVVAFLLINSPYLPIPLAAMAAVVAGMLVFSRRAQRSMFT